MSILVELMTTSEVMSHFYLPWQKMFGQTPHHPWQSPKWCSLTFPLDHPTAPLPFWAIVWVRHEMVGMVPLRRRKASGNPDWEMDLRLLNGGGIMGHQATATLNAVISQLSLSQGKARNWTLSYDPTDRFLCERFELAFQQKRLLPRQVRPEVYGWHLEFKKPGKDIAGATVEGALQWYDNGWGEAEMQKDPMADSLLEYAEELGQLHVLDMEGGQHLAYWKVPLAADPTRGSVTRDATVRIPWAIFGQTSALSKVKVLNALSTVGGRWALQQRLMSCLDSELESQQLPVWAHQHSVDAYRWLAQTRRFTRPSIWDQVRGTLRRDSVPTQREFAQ